ncbi:Acg family FMN-binding oxidoreductase [Histidinibacterium lentulum]|uniref:Acg family FMN-binding oxidoreductase n=1 Tax=Histidinibacterium lentulum TaxID=2480588 RepID=UPI001FE81954|nr:twin-arginine translocation pathway signal protein [Histidinibacterium lentulum]
MSLSRRRTLALIGGGTILAATGGVAWEVTRPLTDAVAPWDLAGSYPDPRMRALSWAILAPNSHNLQPWKVDLSRPDEVVLYPDLDRLLPETDPFNRQITISLGCFLELMRMAALEDGLAVEAELFPEGADPGGLDGRPVAICRFRPTTEARDPLFAQAAIRRSNKEPYDMARRVPTEALARIAAAARQTEVGVTDDPETVAALREITVRAMEIEIDTPRTYAESVEVFRIGRREVEANPDGLEFHGPAFETMRLFGLFTREAAGNPESAAFAQGKTAVLGPIATAMAHIWQVTPDNSRETQIATGRDWLRINLAAVEEGIGFHPLSQGLQEYPEMADVFAGLHDRLAPDGGTVQMLGRLGYGPEIGPTPRWPLEAKIMA